MTYEERIELRDKLFNILKELNVIRFNKRNFYTIYKRQYLIDALNQDSLLKEEYNKYIVEFRSEEEALYCIRHQDDYTNHVCPICKKISHFYISNYSSSKYIPTCGSKECLFKLVRQTNKERYGAEYLLQTEKGQIKFKNTCKELYGDTSPMRTEIGRQHYIETMQKNHGVDWPLQSTQIQQTLKENNLKNLGVEYPLQSPEILQSWRYTYYKNHNLLNIITVKECQSILNQIKNGLTLIDTYCNDDYFKQFIELLYRDRNRLLHLIEVANLFGYKYGQSIKHRAESLDLLNYFDIFDSSLELQFRDFLISNNLIEGINFERRNKDILIQNIKTNGYPELDFYLKDYNLCFEIDDIGTHNIKQKDINYHYNKTIQCLQKDIRLIHLWEWELNETNWPKTSQWILHLLNQSKIQLNLNTDCNNDIRLVDKNEAISFLDRYSLDNERRFNKFIGIYYNNELIELLSFINSRILSICVKFRYELVKGTDKLLNSYIQSLKVPYILTYTDLSKFTGKTLEDIGFKLLQYQKPNIISENITYSKNKQLYNCGYNVYILK